MNGLLMFLSLLGGVSVFGLLGLVLGPLVTALVIALFDAYGAGRMDFHKSANEA